MADFTYKPSEIDEDAPFGVTKVQFGDGYAQRIPEGINNNLRRWSLEFANMSQTDTDAIVAFFRTKAGATSFTWRPQGYSADVHVVCTQYSKPVRNAFVNGTFAYTIKATFEETPL